VQTQTQKKNASNSGDTNANEAEENLWDILDEQSNKVKLKFREKAKSQNSNTLASTNAVKGKGSFPREKERKIGEVVIKVG
jgi:NADH:ubiquinone oxidoreductase subunit